MKKIKLTRVEVRACRNVITFWKKIEGRLKCGEEIRDNYWVDSGKMAIGYGCDNVSKCPFCVLVSGECGFCVYYKAYGYECYSERGHLRKFEEKSNLRTCRLAIRSVERILKNRK